MPMPRRRPSGFSLVELMVALTIGLFIVAGVATLFANNSTTRNELERAQAQVENGRYAMDLIAEDLRMAGYFGDFDPSTLTVPGSTTGATLCVHTLANLPKTLTFPIMSMVPPPTTLCISSAVPVSGTSVLAVRRASTCTNADSGCLDTSSDVMFQASLCTSESATPYKIANLLADMTLHKKDCATTADLRKLVPRIYYVSANHIGSDGIPTLHRLDLVGGNWTATPLVEGIEAMVLEYGVDTNADGYPDPLIDTDDDGTPDQVYVVNPETPCATAACIAANWSNVVAVRVHLLVRTRDVTPGYTDQKTYHLGPQQFPPSPSTGGYNDGYKRRVYSTLVRLNNVSGRRAT